MTPHPYRFALSCLDTPPPCEPPLKRRLPIEALILACAFVAAGSGIATLRAVGHGGHVEIGPAALAHVKAAHKPKPERKATSVETPTAVAQAPLLRGGTHDPKALVAIAIKLQSLGLDVTTCDVQIAKPIATADAYVDMFPARVINVVGPGNHLDGLELRDFPSGSPLREAGLAEGDQLLGVNGFDLADDTMRHVDVLPTRSRGWAVVEVARANHHVVLSIHWPVR
jgi:hypothetical protein